MKLVHKTPCKECPWRKASAQGWLGGFTPEQYTDAVANNEAPACHLKDHGPDSTKTAFCVGALGVAANSCIQLWKSPGAEEARKLIGKRDDCFPHYALFYQHHAGKPYVMPLLRSMQKTKPPKVPVGMYDPYIGGQEAYLEGTERNENPHEPKGRDWDRWDLGWFETEMNDPMKEEYA